MTFHISRDSGNFDSIRGEVAEQIKLLGDLLDDVNLKLVENIFYHEVYGQYNFLICKK